MITKTIPLRTFLDETIFTEMKEKYPLTSEGGRQYKQTSSFFSIMTDFDFGQFIDDFSSSYCELFREEDEKTGISLSDDSCVCYSYEGFTLFMCLNSLMCSSNGYYVDCSKALIRRISADLSISILFIERYLKVLIATNYIYFFDNKLLTIYSVRTFETVQSSRISNRNRKINKPKKNESSVPVISEPLPEPPVFVDDSEPIIEENIEPVIDDDSVLKNLCDSHGFPVSNDTIDDKIEIDGLFESGDNLHLIKNEAADEENDDDYF